MNDFFLSVGRKLSHGLDSPVCPSAFLGNSNADSIFLTPVSECEILKLISGLKDGKAPGIDGIRPRLIKYISHILAPILMHIFNNVFTSGIYPDALKIAKVIPLFKKGDHSLPENYRPISLLPCIDKILESVIEKRMRLFLNKHDIIYKFQFGFREGHSTCHALLEVVDNIRSHLDNGNNVLGLYLDLQKAFDTVDHAILLKKLLHYGIRGKAFNILSNYLCNRKQCTFVNNTYSHYANITTGVPQGSVLGPLLFLIYVNDIQNAAPSVSTRLFADDTNVFLANKDCTKLIEMVTETLSQLKIWFESNKLTLHIGKTTFTIFHARKQCNHTCDESFYFNSTRIRKSPFTKYLGLIIDENLTWKQHVNELRNSLLKYIGIFYHISYILPANTAIQIYFSFIYSRLSYAIEVYGTACASVLKPLQTLQNRILKVLTKKPRRYTTNQLYLDCNLLKIKDIHTYCMGVIVFKYCNDLLPKVLSNVIKPSNVTQFSMHTRNNYLFSVTSHKTLHGKLLLQNYCYNVWHSLSPSVKSSASLRSFQKNLKSFLLNRYHF